jgi:peroxiredoxin
MRQHYLSLAISWGALVVSSATCTWGLGGAAEELVLAGGRAMVLQEVAIEGLNPGQRPPAFAASDLNGNQHTLAQYEGNILVLHFWASWCPYCRSEIPELTQLHQAWASNGVRVLTVSVDENRSRLKRFITQAALPYPVIVDSEANPSIADQYGISGIPVTYIVIRDGRIASRLDGSSDLLTAVRRALAQSPTT